jgi:hypothetical protein
MRHGPSAVVLVCVAAGILRAGFACQPNFVDDSWTRIEVTDQATGDPLQGAQLTVPRDIYFETPEGEVIAKPTDESGQTAFPLTRIGNQPYAGTLLITVSHQGQSDLLALANYTGTTVAGSHFRLRIVDSEAADPGPPVPRIDSDADRIDINGYVRGLVICDCASRRAEWGVSGIGYVVTFMLGTVPEGLSDADNHDSSCMYNELGCSAGLVALAYPPLTNDVQVSERFCIQEDDDIVTCP